MIRYAIYVHIFDLHRFHQVISATNMNRFPTNDGSACSDFWRSYSVNLWTGYSHSSSPKYSISDNKRSNNPYGAISANLTALTFKVSTYLYSNFDHHSQYTRSSPAFKEWNPGYLPVSQTWAGFRRVWILRNFMLNSYLLIIRLAKNTRHYMLVSFVFAISWGPLLNILVIDEGYLSVWGDVQQCSKSLYITHHRICCWHPQCHYTKMGRYEHLTCKYKTTLPLTNYFMSVSNNRKYNDYVYGRC